MRLPVIPVYKWRLQRKLKEDKKIKWFFLFLLVTTHLSIEGLYCPINICINGEDSFIGHETKKVEVLLEIVVKIA